MAVKYLVSDKSGDHLPYTGEDGMPDHRMMGAAWAALHGGYRGNKYAGPNKQAALKKLMGVYKSEKMDMPKESGLPQNQSLDALRDKVSAALRNVVNGRTADDDGDPGEDTCYVWIRDLFVDKVVYSQDGTLYQRTYSKAADGSISFGDPMEVEVAYQPLGESRREMCAASLNLSEAGASYNKKTGELSLTVIKPGLNSSKSRFYPAAVLKRDMGIFENAKMFADHQTEKESKDRPEGSVNNWVGQLGKPWAEQDGTIKAKAKIIDPPFKEKLESLQDANLLHEMGISIRAVGVGSEAEVPDGTSSVKANMVERLVAARSVDFVTFPGAGGRCEVLESDRSNEFDLELIDAATLRSKRPDLIELIESNAREEADKVKTLEQQLQEATDALKAKDTELAAAKIKIEESETAAKKATAAAKLKELLEAAKLPKPAHDRIASQFKEATTTDGMEAAITFEKDYIASIGGKSTTKVTNMGGTETEESDKDKPKVNLVESFKDLFGGNEKLAKIAATGR